jgi:hypothetical protein
LRVKVAVGSSGFWAGCGEVERVVVAGLAACLAAYFWRFEILEGVGVSTEYLDVMRVCECG